MEPGAGEYDDTPKIETAQVRGEGITIDVSWMTMTGTMHIAEALTIKTERGRLELANAEAGIVDESGVVIPIIERAIKAGPHRWALIGWTSYGEGMQSEHVWLVDDTTTPRVIDKLEWLTDRSHAGIALDVGSKLRVGIPLPVPATDPDAIDDEDDETEHLHNQGDWQLIHGAKTYTLAQVNKLPATETHVMALRDFYTPPFSESPSGRHWSGRFVWFAAEGQLVLQRK